MTLLKQQKCVSLDETEIFHFFQNRKSLKLNDTLLTFHRPFPPIRAKHASYMNNELHSVSPKEENMKRISSSSVCLSVCLPVCPCHRVRGPFQPVCLPALISAVGLSVCRPLQCLLNNILVCTFLDHLFLVQCRLCYYRCLA